VRKGEKVAVVRACRRHHASRADVSRMRRAPSSDLHLRVCRFFAGGPLWATVAHRPLGRQPAREGGRRRPGEGVRRGMPGWKRDRGKRLDALIVRNVRKAVKWNSPLYGIEGQVGSWGSTTFTHYVKVTFLRGTSLRPVPPGASKGKDTRYIEHPRRRRARRGADIAPWGKLPMSHVTKCQPSA
jgi:hypothetical protein